MNPSYFVPFSFAVPLIVTIVAIIKSPAFPKLNSVNVLFRERFLSGKNGRIQTYNNMLEVVVTDQDLWIRPFLLFFPVAFLFKGIHRVPLSDIQRIETRGNETGIYFRNSKGAGWFTSLLNLRTPRDLFNPLNN